jgi:hypothetical protein
MLCASIILPIPPPELLAAAIKVGLRSSCSAVIGTRSWRTISRVRSLQGWVVSVDLHLADQPDPVRRPGQPQRSGHDQPRLYWTRRHPQLRMVCGRRLPHQTKRPGRTSMISSRPANHEYRSYCDPERQALLFPVVQRVVHSQNSRRAMPCRRQAAPRPARGIARPGERERSSFQSLLVDARKADAANAAVGIMITPLAARCSIRRRPGGAFGTQRAG